MVWISHDDRISRANFLKMTSVGLLFSLALVEVDTSKLLFPHSLLWNTNPLVLFDGELEVI